MPQTPVQSESPKNPFITQGISKRLLTPCRPVGLSRKRKTPISGNNSFSAKSESLETTPLSSSLVSHNVQESESKINLEKESRMRKGRVSKRLMADEEVVVDSNLEIKKKCVSNAEPMKLTEVEQSPKRSIGKERCATEIDSDVSEDKFEDMLKTTRKFKKARILKIVDDSDEEFDKRDLGTIKNEDKDLKETSTLVSFRKNKVVDSDEEDGSHSKNTATNEIKIVSEDFDPSSEKSNELTKSKESVVKETLENSRTRKNKIADSSDEDDGIILSSLKSKLTEALKPNETKIVNQDFDLSSEKENKLTKSKETDTGGIVNSRLDGEIKENEISEDTTSTEPFHEKDITKSVMEQKPKTMKRSLSLKKSSGDFRNDIIEDRHILKECSVNITALRSDAGTIPRVSEVKDLEREVQSKRKLVEELKRAEIFQKKHDIKEVEAVTGVWKRGCISALNDLLPKLQGHVKMDMLTLLNNLHVPKELVTLSEDGELI